MKVPKVTTRIMEALIRNNLKVCRPRKPILFNTKHTEFREELPKKTTYFWCSILWSDETKLQLFGHSDLTDVWIKDFRPPFERISSS